MTINTEDRKDGPYIGNGVTTVFPFNFKVFTSADLYVVLALLSTGGETVLALTTNYTVSLNADQNVSPGGTITTLTTYASTHSVTITSNIPNYQTMDLTNQGGFYPSVITTALDKATIQIQQLAEQNDRSLTLPISSTASPLLPSPQAYKALAWDSTASVLENRDLTISYSASVEVATFALLGSTAATLGQVVSIKGHTTAGIGGGQFIAKAGSVTNDGGTKINSATVGLYWQRMGTDGTYINTDWFGVSYSTSGIPADQTTLIQSLMDSTAIKGIVFPSGRFGATYLSHTVAKDFIVGTYNTIIMGLATGATRCLFDLRNGNGLHMSGIKFQGQQKTVYTCGVHWYTNDLNSYYPGKADLDIEIGEFLLGMNVGMLASQSTYFAQGTVQAVGTATDAPISECSVRVKIQDCPSGLRICQPNGKITFYDSYIEATSAGWASPTAQSTWTTVELERFGELSFTGGSLENISSSTGTFIKQNGGNIFIESAVIETSSLSKFSGNYFCFRASKMANLGFNNSTLPFAWVKSDAVGTIDIVNSWITWPYQNMTLSTATLAKGVSSLTTGAYAEAPNTLITCVDVELRDPAEQSGGAWRMMSSGVKTKFNNVRLTSFQDVALENILRIRDAKLSNSGVNLLASLVDNSNSTVTASPVTVPSTTGGWTFTSGGGVYAYGRVTPAATLNIETLNGSVQTPTYALRMQANAGVTLTASSPSFNAEPFSTIYVTGWVFITAGGGASIGVKCESRDFADANPSVNTMTLGAANLLQAGWQPFTCWIQQTAGLSKARIQLYVENGVDAQWFGVSAYVDK